MMAFLAGLGIGLVGGVVGGAVFALWTAREASRTAPGPLVLHPPGTNWVPDFGRTIKP